LELREKVAVIVGGSRGIGHAAARSATRNWCRCRAVYRSTETLAVVGANGAGKTTMLRTISGLLRPRRGEVRFEGELIDRLPCHRVVERGVVHVPEGRKVFPSLAVRENLSRSRRPLFFAPPAIASPRPAIPCHSLCRPQAL